jgi:hypothetical protein
MVEPPRNLGRGAVLEIDDGVLVAIEFALVEQGAGAVHQPAVLELYVVANPFPVKTRK